MVLLIKVGSSVWKIISAGKVRFKNKNECWQPIEIPFLTNLILYYSGASSRGNCHFYINQDIKLRHRAQIKTAAENLTIQMNHSPICLHVFFQKYGTIY